MLNGPGGFIQPWLGLDLCRNERYGQISVDGGATELRKSQGSIRLCEHCEIRIEVEVLDADLCSESVIISYQCCFCKTHISTLLEDA